MTKIPKILLQWLAMCLLTSRLAAALPPNVVPFLADEENTVSEEGYLPNKVSSKEFIRAVTANWREVLESVPVIASDDRQHSQALVLNPRFSTRPVRDGDFLPACRQKSRVGCG